MSPEQARALPLDRRTDLYSLGVVLYRMATGRLPFTGQDMFAVLAALALEDPTPVWEVNADVPWPLAKLIMQLLAKSPDDRPATADELDVGLAAVERELKTVPDEILTPVTRALHETPTPLLDLELDAVGLKEEEEVLEVAELEILPDDPPVAKPRPAALLPPERLCELSGHSLGVFEIGPVIGRGHHGLVFRARDGKTGQVVALKVLSPTFPKTDAEAARFTKAMGVGLAMHHPNLVALRPPVKRGLIAGWRRTTSKEKTWRS